MFPFSSVFITLAFRDIGPLRQFGVSLGFRYLLGQLTARILDKVEIDLTGTPHTRQKGGMTRSPKIKDKGLYKGETLGDG